MKRPRKAIRLAAPVLISVLVCASCGERQDAVVSDLGDAGYALTQEDWFRASRSNDLPVMRKFVEGDFDPATRNEDGDTALHAGAAAGATDAAGFLLDRGVAVDVRGAAERTPLMSAVLEDQTATVAWLIRQGADPRAKDSDGFSPLMLAVREGRVGAIAELAAYHRDGLDSALLLAAMLGRTEVIDTLTNYGASVYTRMQDGRTPLMLAAENGHVEAVKLLVEIGGSRFSKDHDGRTAADLAIAKGHESIAELIVRAPVSEELALDPLESVAESMEDYVTAASGDTHEMLSADLTADEDKPATARVRGGTVGSLDGEVVSSRASDEMLAVAASRDASGSASSEFPPLVMRHYREREVPVGVVSAGGGATQLELPEGREVEVREGGVIPGSSLEVVRIQRRLEESKMTLGERMEVTVIEVFDRKSGERREWLSGVAAGAHDPVALVEDAATGRRYLAAQGQQFHSSDGSRFIVSDVRPNQLVIENADTGAVETLPLRGPRG